MGQEKPWPAKPCSQPNCFTLRSCRQAIWQLRTMKTVSHWRNWPWGLQVWRPPGRLWCTEGSGWSGLCPMHLPQGFLIPHCATFDQNKLPTSYGSNDAKTEASWFWSISMVLKHDWKDAASFKKIIRRKEINLWKTWGLELRMVRSLKTFTLTEKNEGGSD